MHLLTFEPLTGALTMFAFQNLCSTRPIRVLPHARVIMRRHWEVLADAALEELSDPVVDALALAPALYVVMTAMLLTLVWSRRWAYPPKRFF
jgi:hypothetical protein